MGCCVSIDAPASGSSVGETPGLVRFFGVLRERWWVLVAAVVLCVAVALALTLHATKQYTAVAKLNFGQNALVGEVGGAQTISADPQADQATNLQLVTTTAIATAVRQSLHLGESPSALLGQVSAANTQSSNVVSISVTDPDPTRAALIANGFADEYVASSRGANLAQIESGIRLLQQQLQALPQTPANSDTRSNLDQALQKLETLAGVQTSNAQVIDRAVAPTSPSSPSTKTNLIVALLFGLILGVGVAFLLDLLDRRLKEVDDFERIYGTHALATIPWLDNSTGAIDSVAGSEQFLILRTGLSVLKPGRDPQVLLVTSAVVGEGKTTVAIGLARAAAAAGQEVILIEGDVRRPTFGSRLGTGNGAPGLTTALMRGTDPVELLYTPLPELLSLRVLPAGPQPHNPVALLGSSQMGALLEQCTREADLVVVDAPPLLPVADTDALLDHRQVDAYLVVGRIGVTKRDEAHLARQRLDRRDPIGLGLVVNGVQEIAGGYYAYDEPPARPSTDGPRRPAKRPVSDQPVSEQQILSRASRESTTPNH